jgi:hypothetical protein
MQLLSQQDIDIDKYTVFEKKNIGFSRIIWNPNAAEQSTTL